MMDSKAFADAVAVMAAGDPAPDPAAQRRRAERDELTRRACLAGIARADAGQAVDPEWLKWARAFVASTPPLRGPLGDGAP